MVLINSQKSLFFNLWFISNNQLCKETLLFNLVWMWDICFIKLQVTLEKSTWFNWSDPKRQNRAVVGYDNRWEIQIRREITAVVKLDKFQLTPFFHHSEAPKSARNVTRISLEARANCRKTLFSMQTNVTLQFEAKMTPLRYVLVIILH